MNGLRVFPVDVDGGGSTSETVVKPRDCLRNFYGDYRASGQRKRKLVEQAFGWMKTVGLLRKLRHRGGELVDWIFTFTAAAYNVVRLRTLLAAEA